MLKTHGRYDYSAITKRPDYSFPGGRRLAVHLSLNVEHFAFGEGLGNDYGAPHPQPNTRSYAWRDYGNRVGAWRLLEFANEYDLPYALLVNTELYDYCPEMIAAFSERGDEIVGHGRTDSERQADMNYEQERACIFEATAAIEKHEGKKPLGWLAPYISQTHDSLELVSRRTPSRLYYACLIDQFDEMLRESERRPLVMPIVLHSFVVGQPYRLRQFRRVIEHILKYRDRVWITRPGEICRFIESLPASIVPGS